MEIYYVSRFARVSTMLETCPGYRWGDVSCLGNFETDSSRVLDCHRDRNFDS
jgi:hypothetical protein